VPANGAHAGISVPIRQRTPTASMCLRVGFRSIEAPKPEASEEIRSEFLTLDQLRVAIDTGDLRSIASYRRAVPGIEPYLDRRTFMAADERYLSH